MDTKPIGQMAYEAYGETLGGVSFISGAKLPPWSSLALEMQAGWTAAADAVMARATPPEAGETAFRPLGLTQAGQARSERQQTEQDAFDRLDPPGC